MNIRNYCCDKLFSKDRLDSIVMSRVKAQGISLMYHEVLSDDESLPAWTVVTQSCFRKQLIFLKKYFDIVTIDEALQRTYGHGQFRKPHIVLTFDDGYKGNYTTVLPIIEELAVPVTVYVASHAIENNQVYWYDRIINLFSSDQPLSIDLTHYNLGKYKLNFFKSEKDRWAVWQVLLQDLKNLVPAERDMAVKEICDLPSNSLLNKLELMTVPEVKDLASSEFVTIGGHSHCHNILTQLSETEINKSLQENRQLLEQWTSDEIRHFSYPDGIINNTVIELVKKNGFVSAVTTEDGYWNGGMNPFLLPRIAVGRFDSLGLFKYQLFRFS